MRLIEFFEFKVIKPNSSTATFTYIDGYISYSHFL